MRSGGLAWRGLLAGEFAQPHMSGPGVLRHHRAEDDLGLAVDAPGGQALLVEDVLEGGVEGLRVRAHAVDPGELGVVVGQGAQVLRTEELGGRVGGDLGEWLPPGVDLTGLGSGQVVLGEELVGPVGLSVLLDGVVPGDRSVVMRAVRGDDALVDGPRHRTELVARTGGEGLGPGLRAGQRPGGVALDPTLIPPCC